MRPGQIEQIRKNLSFWGWSGWQFHNDVTCQTYGFQWQDQPRLPIRYVQGYGPAFMVDDYLKDGEIKIVHWIGSDVMNAMTTRHIPPPDTIHFCDSWDTREELATLGINARVVNHRPKNRIEEPLPLPKQKCLAIYMPPTRHDFFRFDLCDRVAKEWDGNVRWLDLNKAERGENDFNEVMASCSHYLRVPIHDGFSHTAAEFVMAGRAVVTTSERPYQHRALPAVNDILEKLKEEPFAVAPAFYRWLTDTDRLYEAIWEATGW